MNSQPNLLTLIKNNMKNFTRSGKKIGKYILEQPALIVKLSTADMSSACSVGEASLIRFCKAIGFSGFQDLKMNLAISLSTQTPRSQQLLSNDIDIHDDLTVVAEKLSNVLQNVLIETRELLNYSALAQLAELFLQNKHVTFFGVGSSGITADYAMNKFMRIGHQVDSISNNHFMNMKAALMNQDNIAFAISHSGESPETIKALKLAKENRAITVALTNNFDSTLCQFADFVLINGNKETWLQGDSIGTKVAQTFVLDLLYTEIVRNNETQAVEKKLKTTQAIIES